MACARPSSGVPADIAEVRNDGPPHFVTVGLDPNVGRAVRAWSKQFNLLLRYRFSLSVYKFFIRPTPRCKGSGPSTRSLP